MLLYYSGLPYSICLRGTIHSLGQSGNLIKSLRQIAHFSMLALAGQDSGLTRCRIYMASPDETTGKLSSFFFEMGP